MRKQRNKNGEGGTDSRGYRYVTRNGQREFVHRAVVEQVLNMKLPSTVIVHHVDEDVFNNAHENLVVCQDASYHRLLHQRMRALAECGHADWHKCIHCKVWDAEENMYHNKAQFAHFHWKCRYKYLKGRK